MPPSFHAVTAANNVSSYAGHLITEVGNTL